MAATMVERIVAVHHSLEHAGVGHAFGGAIALAFHVRHPRATNDIDVNVFVEVSRAEEVFHGLPVQVRWTSRQLRIAQVQHEAKLRWARGGPVDVFFAKDPYHLVVADRIEHHRFADTELPVISATDLTVFKTLFNREQDWVDVGEMLKAATVDVAEALRWVEHLAGQPGRARLQAAIARHQGPAHS